MPLIQWVSQNILNATIAKGGGVGGGSASVQKTCFIIASGGAKASGITPYHKISSLLSSGGGVGGGSASSIEKSIYFYRKTNYLPGDKVHYRNQPFVVVNLQFNDIEPLFKIAFNNTEESVYQSELSSTSICLNRRLDIVQEKINLLETQPMDNYPIYTEVHQSELKSSTYRQLDIAQEKINLLEAQPMNNYPVYSGKRTVKK